MQTIMQKIIQVVDFASIKSLVYEFLKSDLVYLFMCCSIKNFDVDFLVLFAPSVRFHILVKCMFRLLLLYLLIHD